MNRLTLLLAARALSLRERWHTAMAEPERGNSAETVVLIALFVLLAITVGGVITAKVTGAANSISLP
jgi:hypothetical protein